jgi:putative acetyltransferase
MQQFSFRIVPYNDSHKEQVVAVWESSVRATHSFLDPADIDYYKAIVEGINFTGFSVHCLAREETVLGFVGVAGKKIEMLFLSPDCIGKGLGKMLLSFAINELGADSVDVNEQNIPAVTFYQRFGFVAYARTAKDSEGKNYPILKMKLPGLSNSHSK